MSQRYVWEIEQKEPRKEWELCDEPLSREMMRKLKRDLEYQYPTTKFRIVRYVPDWQWRM